MSKKYDHIDFTPPEGVRKAAECGLNLRKKAPKSSKGGLDVKQASKEGIGSGVQRAVNLKNGDTISPKVIKQMKAFFDRHEKRKSIDKGKTAATDKGYQAWLLWGGDPGRSWANKIIRQMDAADKKTKLESQFTTFVNRFRDNKTEKLINTILEGFEYIYHPDHDDPNPYVQTPTIDQAESVFNSFVDRVPQYSQLSDSEEELVKQICDKYGVTPEDIKMDYMVNHNNEIPIHYLNRVLTDPEINEFDVKVRYVEEDHMYEGKVPAKYRDDKDPTKQVKYDDANPM